MRFSKLLRRPTTLFAVLGAIAFVAFGATPASAHPAWQTYSANSNWDCGPSKNLSISTSVVFQACLISTPDNTKGQLVVVVSNRSTKTVELKGGQFDSDIYGVYDGNDDLGGGFCGFYELTAGQARGCFGETVTIPCGLGLTHAGIVYANSASANRTSPFTTDRYCFS